MVEAEKSEWTEICRLSAGVTELVAAAPRNLMLFHLFLFWGYLTQHPTISNNKICTLFQPPVARSLPHLNLLINVPPFLLFRQLSPLVPATSSPPFGPFPARYQISSFFLYLIFTHHKARELLNLASHRLYYAT
jgi:hypothetical protein